jgi:hypothetical protein
MAMKLAATKTEPHVMTSLTGAIRNDSMFGLSTAVVKQCSGEVGRSSGRGDAFKPGFALESELRTS